MNIFGTLDILSFLSDLGIDIIKAYSEVFNWFSYVVRLPNGTSFTVYELIFTVGLTFFLTSTIVKWVLDFVL